MSVKTAPTDSLFVGIGKIVQGERFVGREHEIAVIKNQVINNHANIAIVGMPRIGKSSLAWQSLMFCKDYLIREKKLIPIRIDVSTITESRSFFHRMTSMAVRELEKLNGTVSNNTIKSLHEISNRIIEDDSYSLSQDFQEFFDEFLRLTSFKLVYILDEFDKTQKIFEFSDFLLLRETAYDPSRDVSYVTISRKSIDEIETRNKENLSNFHGTFSSPIYLREFTHEDLHKYWNRIEQQTYLSEKVKNDITFFAGSHPFFLDFCCNEILSTPNQVLEDNPAIRQKLNDEFNQIIRMMDDKKLLDTAKQVVIGPSLNAEKEEIDELEDWGFLRKVPTKEKSRILLLTKCDLEGDEGDSYVLFSDYFTKLFYYKYFLDIDYWPEWNNTENKLREIVENFFKSKFGDDWIVRISDENDDNWNNNWNTILCRLKDTQRNFPYSTITSPIAVTQTGELYHQFIKRYWSNGFEQIFTDIQENELVSTISHREINWSDVFGFLMKIRNQFAHSNSYLISKEDEAIAKSYCTLILSKIKKWENAGAHFGEVVPDYYVGEIHKRSYNKWIVKPSDGKPYTYIWVDGFAKDYKPQEGDKVVFQLKSVPHRKKPGETFKFAIIIRLKSDEGYT